MTKNEKLKQNKIDIHTYVYSINYNQQKTNFNTCGNLEFVEIHKVHGQVLCIYCQCKKDLIDPVGIVENLILELKND